MSTMGKRIKQYDFMARMVFYITNVSPKQVGRESLRNDIILLSADAWSCDTLKFIK